MKSILLALEEKKKQLDQYQPFPTDLVKNLSDWFRIELTYTSNAIEGNTLSRAETALVVGEGLVVQGKTLTEHLEAVNHAQAFDFVMKKVSSGRKQVTENTILDLYQMILRRIDDTNAGRYRSVPVRIAGSTVILPNALKVPDLMNQLADWLAHTRDHPVTVAIDCHYKLVSIHPFVDGNGRTARLLMNLLLLQAGYLPIIIRKEDRGRYISCLEKAQLGGSMSDYYALMYEALDRSLDVYLEALADNKQKKTFSHKKLLKIGQLAQLADETVATIRHWTQQRLLSVIDYTAGGYQLYEQQAVAKVRQIRQLQKDKRLTLSEIKQLVESE